MYMQVLKDSSHLPRSSPDFKRKLLLETKIKFIIFAAIKRKRKSTSVLNRAWSKAGGSIQPSLVYWFIHLSSHLLKSLTFSCWVSLSDHRKSKTPVHPSPPGLPMHHPFWASSHPSLTLKSFTVFLLSFFRVYFSWLHVYPLDSFPGILLRCCCFLLRLQSIGPGCGVNTFLLTEISRSFSTSLPLTSHQTLPPRAWHKADIQYFSNQINDCHPLPPTSRPTCAVISRPLVFLFIPWSWSLGSLPSLLPQFLMILIYTRELLAGPSLPLHLLHHLQMSLSSAPPQPPTPPMATPRP